MCCQIHVGIVLRIDANNMRVCLFTSTNDKNEGGPSRSVPILAKGLSEIGCDTILMTRETANMNFHVLEEGSNVHIIVLPYSIRYDELEKTILAGHYDVIHIQCIWTPIYHQVIKIARKHGIKYIITPRGTLEPWSMSKKRLKKCLAMMLYQRSDLHHADAILATADLEAQHIRELGFKNPIAIIPNGIDISEYRCRPVITKNKVKKQLLFLSRIHEKKGLELLISAWETLQSKYPDWNVLIAGNGEKQYIQQLRKIINEKSLENSIRIVPPVFGEEKRELYSESSLFVLPSYSENFGMVIAEAMSCGVPVITTTGTPWEELNKMGIGWCINLSVENLIEAIDNALSLGCDQLFDLGQKCHDYVANKYQYIKVAENNLVLYRWLLNPLSQIDFLYQ